MPKDSFALSPRTAYGMLSSNDRRSIAQRQRQRRRHPPITHHHLEYRKRRNVLLIFADNAQPNIGWPSIVQHLASFHPAVIHHNSTASTSRHVITLRPYLFCVRLLLTFLPPTMDGRHTLLFPTCPFSIRNTIHYLCTLTPPHTSIHTPLAAFAGL